MIDISLGGLIGAILGTIVAAVLYGVLAEVVRRAFKKRRSPDEPALSAAELALLRRGILAMDILVCGGIGYWIGQEIGG